MPKELRKGFDSMVLLIGWMLWKERNERTFSNKTRTVVWLLQDMMTKELIGIWQASDSSGGSYIDRSLVSLSCNGLYSFGPVRLVILGLPEFVFV